MGNKKPYRSGNNQFTGVSLFDRFKERKYHITGRGCWEWIGTKNWAGYGFIQHEKKALRAHRVSYEFYKGEIPEGMFVCHTCDNPPCINPEHLWLGTAKDNSIDCKVKGRNKLQNCPSMQAYSRGCRCEKCVEIFRALRKQYQYKYLKNNPIKKRELMDIKNARRNEKYRLKKLGLI